MKKPEQQLFFRREAFGEFRDSIAIVVTKVEVVTKTDSHNFPQGTPTAAIAHMPNGEKVIAAIFVEDGWHPSKRWDPDEGRYERMVSEWR